MPLLEAKKYAYRWRTSLEMLLLLGKKVLVLQQKGEIGAGTRNIEPLAD
jgi:hypothetical protein